MTGPVVLGSVGWGFGNGLRTELEANFRSNGLNNGSGIPPSGGTLYTYGVMVNALYDFDIGQSWVFPYVGVGVGYEEEYLTGGHIGTAQIDNSGKGGFAAQGIVGAAFPIDSAPGLSFTAEYRFFDVVNNPKYNTSVPNTSLKLIDTMHNSILFGLRYAFNAAPPPPPPAPAPTPVAAPAPAPARTYLVFFDWDKADLTDRAKQIIARGGAELSTRCRLTRIEVNGYTDTSGSPAYNQKLSVAPRPERCRRTGARRRAAERDHRPGLRRHASAGADRGRRARAAEPPRRDHPEVGPATSPEWERAPSWRPFSCAAFKAMRPASLVPVAFAPFMAGASPAPSAIGAWFTADGQAAIRVAPCAAPETGMLCDRIAWLRTPLDAAARPRPISTIRTRHSRRATSAGCGCCGISPRRCRALARWVRLQCARRRELPHDDDSTAGRPDGRLALRGYVGIPLLGESRPWAPAAASQQSRG